jgi:hypothetical protein
LYILPAAFEGRTDMESPFLLFMKTSGFMSSRLVAHWRRAV